MGRRREQVYSLCPGGERTVQPVLPGGIGGVPYLTQNEPRKTSTQHLLKQSTAARSTPLPKNRIRAFVFGTRPPGLDGGTSAARSGPFPRHSLSRGLSAGDQVVAGLPRDLSLRKTPFGLRVGTIT